MPFKAIMIRAEFIDSDSAFQNAVRLHGHLLLSNLFPLHNHKAKFRGLNDGNNCWSGETRELSVDPTTGQHRTYREQYNYIIYFACMHACKQARNAGANTNLRSSSVSPALRRKTLRRVGMKFSSSQKLLRNSSKGFRIWGDIWAQNPSPQKKQYQLSISSESKFMCI